MQMDQTPVVGQIRHSAVVVESEAEPAVLAEPVPALAVSAVLAEPVLPEPVLAAVSE